MIRLASARAFTRRSSEELAVARACTGGHFRRAHPKTESADREMTPRHNLRQPKRWKIEKASCVVISQAILLCLLSSAHGQGGWGRREPSASSNVEAVARELSKQAIALKSVEAGHGFEDLQPLKKALAGVRIVGLGEATHGTHEFFQFKHRMVEFLVKEMGFTVLAMEVSYPAALDINEFVLYGKGDCARALAGQGLWAWDTNEITELLQWMRRYNQTAPEGHKVKFVGFDMHNNEKAMDAVVAYLRKVAPERVEDLQKVFQLFRATELGRQHFEYISNVSVKEKARVQAAMNELLGFLLLNQVRFREQTSTTEFEQVMRHARILAQFTDIYRRPLSDPQNPTVSSGYTRDFYMAENIERIAEEEKPGAGIITWAHNEHVGVGVYEHNMGEYLRRRFGTAYYALGTSFNQGGFQARLLSPEVTIGAVTEFNIGPAPERTIEWYFTRTGMKAFLVDFRSLAKDETIAPWSATPRAIRSIGLGFSPQEDEPLTKINLQSTFDGLAFIEKTTRARPNPTGLRGAWIIPERN